MPPGFVKRLPSSGLEYGNLVFAYLNVGRLADAHAAAQMAASLDIDNSFIHEPLYLVAFLERDETAMRQQLAASKGNRGVEHAILYFESDTAAYAGELLRARKLTAAAVTYAQQVGQPEMAGQYEAEGALREAVMGSGPEASRLAQTALDLSKGKDVEAIAATALALTGDGDRPSALANDLSQRFPKDTIVQFIYLPSIRAALYLSHRMPAKAIEALDASSRYEFGSPAQTVNVALYPVYFRGQAYLAAKQPIAALAEFKKILINPGVVLNEPIGNLAHLGVARALYMNGEIKRAKDAYEEFFWHGKRRTRRFPY